MLKLESPRKTWMVGNCSSVVLNREMILLPHPGTFGSIWRRVWSTQLGQAAAPGI